MPVQAQALRVLPSVAALTRHDPLPFTSEREVPSPVSKTSTVLLASCVVNNKHDLVPLVSSLRNEVFRHGKELSHD
jgi:hypothetical protein